MSSLLESQTQLARESDESLNEADDFALSRKLKSKIEAFAVLSQELDKCRKQRDQFKLMAEQIQDRFLKLKTDSLSKTETASNGTFRIDDDSRAIELLAEVREQNKCLRLQVKTLRQKLGDAQGDIKVLRTTSHCSIDQPETQLAPAVHQREEMIEQLEKLNIKCAQLQTDLQTLLDEKHELEIERDAFKCKSHRLNHELSKALNATKPVDLDSLINENRYLQERSQQLLEERELAQQSLAKYKSMLDSKRIKGTIKLGGNSAAGTIMTHKQVEQLLQQGSQLPAQASAAAVNDLRRLCTALLEALNDKTLALAHQKKANKILALRICELENTVQSPTSKLLEGYAGSDVDTRLGFEGYDEYSECTKTMSSKIGKGRDEERRVGKEESFTAVFQDSIDHLLHNFSQIFNRYTSHFFLNRRHACYCWT
ncbi:coiled-coil domain-containing protein 149 isoform X2 [Neodiprion lecontei]|uniref:Coiled-coil domain-containing protein 149 isoform X2 n=1 Tax=Neodiprion lecontei TaxID=441921 RepID=A0ABM3FPH2_NEOLC|nr:coiled-coil domain-containing protein 149 isoform X2 [Neodiprion lecontei]